MFQPPRGHSGPRVCPPGPPGLHVHLPSPALTLRGEAAIGFLGLPTPMPSVTPSLTGKPKGLAHGCRAEQGSGGRVKTLKGDRRERKSAGPDTCQPPPRPSPPWSDGQTSLALPSPGAGSTRAAHTHALGDGPPRHRHPVVRSLWAPWGPPWPGTPTCARHLCLPWSSLCLC